MPADQPRPALRDQPQGAPRDDPAGQEATQHHRLGRDGAAGRGLFLGGAASALRFEQQRLSSEPQRNEPASTQALSPARNELPSYVERARGEQGEDVGPQHPRLMRTARLRLPLFRSLACPRLRSFLFRDYGIWGNTF